MVSFLLWVRVTSDLISGYPLYSRPVVNIIGKITLHKIKRGVNLIFVSVYFRDINKLSGALISVTPNSGSCADIHLGRINFYICQVIGF